MPEGQKTLSARSIELQRARPISELRLPSRAANGLARHGVNSIGQLIARSRQDLKNEINGLGIGSIRDIEEALKREGLSLATGGRASRYSRPLSRHARNHHAWLDGLPILKEAGLKEAGLKEAGLKEAGLKEAGLKEAGGVQ